MMKSFLNFVTRLTEGFNQSSMEVLTESGDKFVVWCSKAFMGPGLVVISLFSRKLIEVYCIIVL